MELKYINENKKKTHLKVIFKEHSDSSQIQNQYICIFSIDVTFGKILLCFYILVLIFHVLSDY